MILLENEKPHLWQLVQEIKFDPYFTNDEYGFEFVIKNEDIKLSNGLTSKIEYRRKLVSRLEELEAIKILEKNLPIGSDYPFRVRMLQPKFEEIFKELEDKFTKKTIDQLEPMRVLQKSKKIVPFDIPKDTEWEDVEIKFKNRYDVEIRIRGAFFNNSNNEEMGFFRSGTTDKMPDKQWEFLQHLSTYVNFPSIHPTIDTIAGSLKIKSNDCMKIKEKLSKGLKEIFGIKDEPFRDYEETKCYKTKFKLIPEVLLRNDGEIRLSNGRYNENIEYLTEEEKGY